MKVGCIQHDDQRKRRAVRSPFFATCRVYLPCRNTHFAAGASWYRP